MKPKAPATLRRGSMKYSLAFTLVLIIAVTTASSFWNLLGILPRYQAHWFMRKITFRVLLSVSFAFLLGFLLSLILESTRLTGPFLTLFFISLAISFHGHEKLKKFAYTIWIFAAVTISMNYPELFRQLGDFELKRLHSLAADHYVWNGITAECN